MNKHPNPQGWLRCRTKTSVQAAIRRQGQEFSKVFSASTHGLGFEQHARNWLRKMGETLPPPDAFRTSPQINKRNTDLPVGVYSGFRYDARRDREYYVVQTTWQYRGKKHTKTFSCGNAELVDPATIAAARSAATAFRKCYERAAERGRDFEPDQLWWSRWRILFANGRDPISD